jgi:hypothetical protein
MTHVRVAMPEETNFAQDAVRAGFDTLPAGLAPAAVQLNECRS